jgi:predicted DCC family thiol-disulfide oxidoreductase YuxK
MDARDTAARPVLYWDADCNFCRRWIGRWNEATGDAVEYQTLQGAPAQIVEAAGGIPFQRVVLRRVDGTLATGAAAALEAVSEGGCGGRLVHRFAMAAPFRALAERAYSLVATHRGICSKLTDLLWGPDLRRPTYQISGYLFPRLVGLVFVFAFISLWVQIDGLAGSRGILPVAAHLQEIKNHFAMSGAPHQAWLQVPSFLWFGAGDTALHLWLGVGTLASLLLVLGWFPAASAFVAWACYLSFAAAVPVFLNFQWDALLLETGLLVVFFVPWSRRLRYGSSAPPRLARLLVWWLLFRLMFESGVVKLFGFDGTGRNAWLDGTALDYHYFTQPIPVWTSWWFAALPGWFHVLSLAAVFAIELLAPFLLAGPRRLRMAAFWSFVLLMLLIMASGHYGFFNLLTLALCVTLVDDACWPARLRGKLPLRRETRSSNRTWPETVRAKLLPVFAVLVIALTALQLFMVLRLFAPSSMAPLLGPFVPFRSANSYGLFSVMTTERPEITIEASRDGLAWEPYRFRHKMDADRTSMPFLVPHMPRLDWQMWFAALEYRASGRPPGWMMPLLGRLQEQSPAVLALFDGGEPAGPAPLFFRLRLDLLTFVPPGQSDGSARYWRADSLPAYTIEGRLQR